MFFSRIFRQFLRAPKKLSEKRPDNFIQNKIVENVGLFGKPWLATVRMDASWGQEEQSGLHRCRNSGQFLCQNTI
jgi:hypothetical protein